MTTRQYVVPAWIRSSLINVCLDLSVLLGGGTNSEALNVVILNRIPGQIRLYDPDVDGPVSVKRIKADGGGRIDADSNMLGASAALPLGERHVQAKGISPCERVLPGICIYIWPGPKADWVLADEPLQAGVVVARPIVVQPANRLFLSCRELKRVAGCAIRGRPGRLKSAPPGDGAAVCGRVPTPCGFGPSRLGPLSWASNGGP